MPSATVSAGRNIECRWPKKPVAVAADREEPAELSAEREEQHDPEPERREAEPDERHRADHVVRTRRSCLRGGERRERDGDQHREHRSVDDQPERDRQPVDDQPPAPDTR